MPVGNFLSFGRVRKGFFGSRSTIYTLVEDVQILLSTGCDSVKVFRAGRALGTMGQHARRGRTTPLWLTLENGLRTGLPWHGQLENGTSRRLVCRVSRSKPWRALCRPPRRPLLRRGCQSRLEAASLAQGSVSLDHHAHETLGELRKSLFAAIGLKTQHLPGAAHAPPRVHPPRVVLTTSRPTNQLAASARSPANQHAAFARPPAN